LFRGICIERSESVAIAHNKLDWITERLVAAGKARQISTDLKSRPVVDAQQESAQVPKKRHESGFDASWSDACCDR
jgi:hypothetical protein